MKKQLGEEYEEYLRSFDSAPQNGLRVNTAKLSAEEFERISPFELKRIPWVTNGFFYEGERPAVHPFYYAGLYYLQEPSAMTPASLLPVHEGERVLDLCAAPGGKSTELAAKLKGTGVLVSNDISSTRAKALLKNLELFGTPNALVVSEAPNRLCEHFEGYFDKILVDAPCSGEGMFRKKPAIMKNWEQYGTDYYRDIQREIMPFAVRMLRPGGMLLYSTCTFCPDEDEGTVQAILDEFPDMQLVDPLPLAKQECEARGEGFIPDYTGFSHGNPALTEGGSEELTKTIRLMPHKIRGEGHFIALFKKGGEVENGSAPRLISGAKRPAVKLPDEAKAFLDRLDIEIDTGRLELRGEQLYLLPKTEVPAKGLRTLRFGLLLGEIKTKRFEPSQALACALKASGYANRLELKAEDERVLKYLKCETIDVDEELENGYVLVCVEGFPLGWAKYRNGSFKNKYLPGWRHM